MFSQIETVYSVISWAGLFTESYDASLVSLSCIFHSCSSLHHGWKKKNTGGLNQCTKHSHWVSHMLNHSVNTMAELCVDLGVNVSGLKKKTYAGSCQQIWCTCIWGAKQRFGWKTHTLFPQRLWRCKKKQGSKNDRAAKHKQVRTGPNTQGEDNEELVKLTRRRQQWRHKGG